MTARTRWGRDEHSGGRIAVNLAGCFGADITLQQVALDAVARARGRRTISAAAGVPFPQHRSGRHIIDVGVCRYVDYPAVRIGEQDPARRAVRAAEEAERTSVATCAEGRDHHIFAP